MKTEMGSTKLSWAQDAKSWAKIATKFSCTCCHFVRSMQATKNIFYLKNLSH